MNGQANLTQVLRQLGHRNPPAKVPDCQQPDCPADLPTTHALQLASIEGRLARLENAVTSQNRRLLIGVIALIGELA